MHTRMHEATLKLCRTPQPRGHTASYGTSCLPLRVLCSFLSFWLLRDVKQGSGRKKKKVGCSRRLKKKFGREP